MVDFERINKSSNPSQEVSTYSLFIIVDNLMSRCQGNFVASRYNLLLIEFAPRGGLSVRGIPDWCSYPEYFMIFSLILFTWIKISYYLIWVSMGFLADDGLLSHIRDKSSNLPVIKTSPFAWRPPSSNCIYRCNAGK